MVKIQKHPGLRTCFAISVVTIAAYGCGSGSTGGGATSSDPQTNTNTDTGVASTCIDQDSSNSDWSDNCVLSQTSSYAISSYTRGVQRILWCQGIDQESTTIENFANGVFGPETEQAVKEYQEVAGLNSSGAVESSTWAALRDLLDPIEFSTNDDELDSYGVIGCDDLGELFFQQANSSVAEQLLGWTMIEAPGSTEIVEFSTNP